jgi:hypothetical protein
VAWRKYPTRTEARLSPAAELVSLVATTATSDTIQAPVDQASLLAALFGSAVVITEEPCGGSKAGLNIVELVLLAARRRALVVLA